ncbi:uncharacterized protein LOC135476817 isoform X2 [Liolophura sinensis]|uniref:uncharacterized protein LOC135476817 isoform X2 n=1 Tax=Liolophura sinensis TaxID=3198878 RepID=UPI0031595160
MKSSEYLSTRLDSVMELMEKGLLRSGQGNLTLTIKGVCHRGSVMQDGRIHSREGTFKTPTGWVSKVTGVKVKKQAAYDTVMFKGVPLSKLRTASVPSGVSGEEGTETCKDTPGKPGLIQGRKPPLALFQIPDTDIQTGRQHSFSMVWLNSNIYQVNK